MAQKKEGQTAADPRRKVAAVGPISIVFREQTNSYYLRTWDPVKRRIVMRSAKATSLEKAKAAARNWKAELEKGHRESLLRRCERLSVKAALEEGIRLGGRANRKKSEEHEGNLRRFAGYFEDWLGGRARYWDEVDARLLHRYVEHLNSRGVKPKTIRHYLAPVLSTASYWSLVDDSFRPLRVSHPCLDLGRPVKKFLTLEQLERCIEGAAHGVRDKEGDLIALPNRKALIGFIMAGMSGLRLREVAAITRAAFDAEKGILSCGTKNDASIRTIPLLKSVREFLVSCFDTEMMDCLVYRQSGEPGIDDTVAKPMKRILVALGYGHIDPKSAGRKTFMNWAKLPGVDSDVFDAYVGHAPRRTADRFYRLYSIDQMRALVVDPLEHWLNGDRSTARVVEMHDKAVTA